MLLLAATLLASTGVASAEEANEHARSGPYLSLGFVWAASAFDTDAAEAALPAATRPLGTTISSGNAWGLDARAGYRFHPRVAAEAQYQYVPGFDLDRNVTGHVADVNTQTFTVNGKVFALTDTFQPYFVGGIGFLHADTDPGVAGLAGDGTGFAGRAGVGADYYVRPNVVVSVEFSAVLPTGPVDDVRILPLVAAAQYRF